jgi:VIT1/CCC1 family predicted Fe2+/Mn2+ transporter
MIAWLRASHRVAHRQQPLGRDCEPLADPNPPALQRTSEAGESGQQFSEGTASLLAFSLGALLPRLPYLLGFPVLAATLTITAMALVAGGVAVGKLTGRSTLHAGLRQLTLDVLAIAVIFTIGSLISGHPA